MTPIVQATGPARSSAIDFSPASHGIVDTPAWAFRLNARATVVSIASLLTSNAFSFERTIFMTCFLSSFYDIVSNRLDRILPVGISRHEQDLSDLSARRGSELLVDEHHEVDSFRDQRATELMRHTLTLIRLR